MKRKKELNIYGKQKEKSKKTANVIFALHKTCADINS